MTTITIYGVGLIGGSLALSFKGKPGYRVIGHSNNPESVKKYLERETVDEATTSFEEAAEEADFIFICVPVGLLESYMQKLSRLPLKKGCIVTDVGSTKASVAKQAAAIDWPSDVYFIGGHPMAGSERSGVEAASSHLFENAFYVLTPASNVPTSAYVRLTELLKRTKARIIRVGADEHDEIVGAISHLPHIIAAALVNQVARYNDENDLYELLAAGGFRDITRIASCDPVIWRDILLNNRQVLLELLKDWKEEMNRFVHMLESEDGEQIEQQFRSAGQFRGRLPERRKGVMFPMYDVYVDVPDTPGVIGRIASELGSRDVNLSNIQIFESREEVPGVLRLSFRNEDDLEKAVHILKACSFSVHF